MNGILVSIFLPFSVVLLFAISYVLGKMNHPTQLQRLEAKIDLLLAHHGVIYDPLAGLAPQVAETIRSSDTIAAIRAYRGATGASLLDAKTFVENLRRS